MGHGFIPVANTASVELIYSQVVELSENVFHVQKGSPFTLADLQALRAVVDNWDNTSWKARRTNGASLVRIRTKALDTASSPQEDYYLPSPRAGTFSSSVSVALNACICIKLGTGVSGRSQRGRMYVGNLNNGQLSDAGHLATSELANMVGSINGLISALATAGYTMVVTSYRTGGAYRAAGHNTPVISAVGVDNSLDSQRRRLPGRGHAI